MTTCWTSSLLAGRTFLLVETPPSLLAYLDGYDADREDMEDGGDYEGEAVI